MFAGFCEVEIDGFAPAKVHCHEVGLLEDKSVKFTHPESQKVVLLDVKLGTGNGQEFTVI